MNNFDKIQKVALDLISKDECPEAATDFLLKLTADTTSLSHIVCAIAAMSIYSKEFNELMVVTCREVMKGRPNITMIIEVTEEDEETNE
jgi:fibrillarin-like rRNA methylase